VSSDAAAQLGACGFPARWAGAARCVLLQTAFGDGQGVLAAWNAWHAWLASRAPGSGQPVFDSPQLVIVSIAPRLPAAAELLRRHACAPWAPLAVQLAAAWPPATPDLHVLDLEPGVRLLLAVGPRAWLRQLRLQANVVLLDEQHPPPGAPAGAGHWDIHARKALSRLMAPQAVLLGSSTTLPATHPPRAAAGRWPKPASRHAIVIGAGIAGTCSAAALARAGWTCSVLDAHAAPAHAASGNPAALFHGTVHAGDGLHARFTRACALRALHVHRALIAAGVPGRADGLLRAHADLAANVTWPADWVQRLDAEGLHRHVPALRADSAWYFPGGGWIDAAAAARQLLDTPGIRFHGGAAIHALQRCDADWCVLDAQGRTLASAPTVVLATAGQWPELLDAHGQPAARHADLPAAQRTRGQVTWFDCPASLPYPVAGEGYAVAWQPGQMLCGASSQPCDDDARVRDSDHQFNLQRLAALTGITPASGAVLHGRVGWRHQTADRLPLLGAVPAAPLPLAQRPERLRDVERLPGLWVLAGMGGRGFTWAPLLGEVLGAMVAGGPLPMDTRLVDAVDPARQLLRQARRAVAG